MVAVLLLSGPCIKTETVGCLNLGEIPCWDVWKQEMDKIPAELNVNVMYLWLLEMDHYHQVTCFLLLHEKCQDLAVVHTAGLAPSAVGCSGSGLSAGCGQDSGSDRTHLGPGSELLPGSLGARGLLADLQSWLALAGDMSSLPCEPLQEDFLE